MKDSFDLDRLVRARRGLQSVAEHVMSAALFSATGRIGLRQSAGGFSTPEFRTAAGHKRIRVDGTDLVVALDGSEARTPLTTLRRLGEFAGVEPGAPSSVYPPSTPLDLDSPLDIDPVSAARLSDWYQLAGSALESFRDELAGSEPSIIQLWPEHFDLACTIGEVNYGGSPGDEDHDVPYLYVGPFSPPTPDGAFWNEPFGASRNQVEIASVDAALTFFRGGALA